MRKGIKIKNRQDATSSRTVYTVSELIKLLKTKDFNDSEKGSNSIAAMYAT